MPNSITLASSELAPNMFGASSELASVMEFGFKKPQQVTSHVFAETTHVVAAPHGFAGPGFACVVIPPDVAICAKFHRNRLRDEIGDT